jgi:hypothetical protein
MGDGEAAAAPSATAPQDDIKVKNARGPALARPSAETPLYGFEMFKKITRLQIAVNEGDSIGVAPCARTDRRSLY